MTGRHSKEKYTSLLMLAETDVSALCIDVSRVKSLTGEPRKSVSLAALALLTAVCVLLEFFYDNGTVGRISRLLLEDTFFSMISIF